MTLKNGRYFVSFELDSKEIYFEYYAQDTSYNFVRSSNEKVKVIKAVDPYVVYENHTLDYTDIEDENATIYMIKVTNNELSTNFNNYMLDHLIFYDMNEMLIDHDVIKLMFMKLNGIGDLTPEGWIFSDTEGKVDVRILIISNESQQSFDIPFVFLSQNKKEENFSDTNDDDLSPLDSSGYEDDGSIRNDTNLFQKVGVIISISIVVALLVFILFAFSLKSLRIQRNNRVKTIPSSISHYNKNRLSEKNKKIEKLRVEVNKQNIARPHLIPLEQNKTTSGIQIERSSLKIVEPTIKKKDKIVNDIIKHDLDLEKDLDDILYLLKNIDN